MPRQRIPFLAVRLQWTQSTGSNTSWQPSGAGAAFLVEGLVSVSFVTATCLFSTIPAADHGAPSRLALGWACQWIHGRPTLQAESVSELIDLITVRERDVFGQPFGQNAQQHFCHHSAFRRMSEGKLSDRD